MTFKVSRRAALQYLSCGAILAACSNGRGAEGATEHEPRWEFDPNRPWWLQPPFAPVSEENEAFDLAVKGAIPRSLDGLFVRNGSNPKHGDRGSWLIGDGMLHGVRLQDGKARWYRNRYVQTPVLERDPREGLSPVARLTDTTSNVSLVHHAGRLLSLGEAGLPFEISPDDLSTVGAYDFAGRLKTFMTAHPKLDPRTGEMHMFGYGLGEPYLTYHLVDPSGALSRSEPIVLPHSVMIHDFQITESQIVFMDLPVAFSPALALAKHGMPFRWKPENGARIGVMPRAGGDVDITWIEIEPCFVFHAFNAYDDAAGNVVIEVCEYPHMWVEESTTFDSDPSVCRYTIDVAAKTAKRRQLDDRRVDFPRIDPRLVGSEHRYGYGLWSNSFNLSNFRQQAWVKYDRKRDTSVTCEFEPHRTPGEPFFIPASQDAAEDEGYLISFVSDASSLRGSLEIFDARTLSNSPIASIQLPWHVPFGIHGTWIAS
jgi:carotenoid cleavage dioxygenase